MISTRTIPGLCKVQVPQYWAERNYSLVASPAKIYSYIPDGGRHNV